MCQAQGCSAGPSPQRGHLAESGDNWSQQGEEERVILPLTSSGEDSRDAVKPYSAWGDPTGTVV